MEFTEKIQVLKNLSGELKPHSFFLKDLRCNVNTLLSHGFVKKEGEKGYYRIVISSDFDVETFIEEQKNRQPWRKTNPVWRRKYLEKQKKRNYETT